jgi:hypothetical protein
LADYLRNHIVFHDQFVILRSLQANLLRML